MYIYTHTYIYTYAMSEALYRIYMYRICIISTVGLPFCRAGGAERGRFLASVCFHSRRQVPPKTKMWNLRGFRMDLPKCGRRCHEVPKLRGCCAAQRLSWKFGICPLAYLGIVPILLSWSSKLRGLEEVSGDFMIRWLDGLLIWLLKLYEIIEVRKCSEHIHHIMILWMEETVFNWCRISQPSAVSHLNFEPCLNHPCWEGQAQMCHRHSVAGEVCDGAEEPLPGRLGNEGMEIQEVKILWMEEILS